MATTKTIDLRTAIPGPRSAAILERKQRAVANAKSVILPVVAQSGRGATLTDVDGNVFIDFTGGVGCLNVGHAHPRVVEAVQEQAALFTHTDFTVVPYEVYVTLAERLLGMIGIRDVLGSLVERLWQSHDETAHQTARSLFRRQPSE